MDTMISELVADKKSQMRKLLRKKLEETDNYNELTHTVVIAGKTMTVPPPLSFSTARQNMLDVWDRMFQELSDEVGVDIGLSPAEVKEGSTDIMIVFLPKGYWANRAAQEQTNKDGVAEPTETETEEREVKTSIGDDVPKPATF